MTTVRRRFVALGAVVVIIAAGVAVGLVVSGGGGSAASGVTDNEYPLSTYTIERGSLVSQTEVSGTLGYGATASIVLPPGTPASSMTQPEDQLASAQQNVGDMSTSLSNAQASAAQALAQAERGVTTAEDTLASDRSTLESDQAILAADEQKEAVDCAGTGAGASPGGTGSGSSSACATDTSEVTADRATVAADEQKVAGDEAAVTSAEASVASTTSQNDQSIQQATDQLDTAELALSQDESSLSTAESDLTIGGTNPVYTTLPSVGQTVRRGGTLMTISNQPVWLLYGTATPDTAFYLGMAPSAAVAELNANLDALGFGHALHGDVFSAATEGAVQAMQTNAGVDPTGVLPLGSVVFQPGAVLITSVTPTLGSATTPGQAVLSVSSLARQVSIALDTTQESEVAVGDQVSIVLPNNATTPGVVSSVGKVATASNSNSSSSAPTVTVLVTPTDPAATGSYVSAPVNVNITTASVSNVYVAPVDALLALASGGYALEAIGANGVHYLVAVNLGMFDDASGDVQVSGAGVTAGLRVVVPGV